MADRRFLALKADLEHELGHINRLAQEMAELLPKLGDSPTRVEIRAVGGILHDFYCGVEKIFLRIVSEMETAVPAGSDWRVRLLSRMTVAVDGIRPPVISETLAEKLDEYLRFRHIFRNVYGFRLNWDRFQRLAEALAPTHVEVDAAIHRFLQTMQHVSDSL